MSEVTWVLLGIILVCVIGLVIVWVYERMTRKPASMQSTSNEDDLARRFAFNSRTPEEQVSFVKGSIAMLNKKVDLMNERIYALETKGNN